MTGYRPGREQAGDQPGPAYQLALPTRLMPLPEQAGQGSSLFYRGHVVHEYRNETNQPTKFYVVVGGTGAR